MAMSGADNVSIKCIVDGCECGRQFASMAELAHHLDDGPAGKGGSARRPGGKFGVSPAEERRFRGVTYRSKLEMRRAVQLYHELISGGVLLVIYEPMIRDLGCPENTYRPDFMVFAPVDGVDTLWFEDVKGAEPRGWAHTVKLWRSHGPAPLHILKRGKAGAWRTTIIPKGRQKKTIES